MLWLLFALDSLRIWLAPLEVLSFESCSVLVCAFDLGIGRGAEWSMTFVNERIGKRRDEKSGEEEEEEQ